MNRQELVDTFLEYIQIDCESFHERKMADTLKTKLISLGFYVEEDTTNTIFNSDTGNIYAYLKGELEGSILLSAHMDTVRPGIGKQGVYDKEKEIIYSKGNTVLGGDDLCSIIAILKSIECIQRQGLKHRDIEIVLSYGEEVHCRGISVFDFSKIKSKEAYVFDMTGDVGSAALKAPSIIQFEIDIYGKSAHAGFEPEKGRNAIQVLSNIITDLPQGRIDEETTMNVGYIEGGVGTTNIVCDHTRCIGEVRSFNHDKALHYIEKIETIIKDKLLDNMSYDFKVDVFLQAYELQEDDQVIKRFKEACQKENITPVLCNTFGGSDNNHIMAHGIQGVVLSCGMFNVHSTSEYLKVVEVEKLIKIITHFLCD